MATIRHRRRLGRELGRLRDARGLSQGEVASTLGWSRPTVGRIEAAKTKDVADATRQLLDLYEVGGDERERLLRLAEESADRGWWESYADVFPSNYVALEDEAAEIRAFQSQLIPGLLQIEPYTRAVIAATRDDPPDVIARKAQARGLRRALLGRQGAPHLRAVLDESVLHRQIGGPDTMKAQLAHLYHAANQPNITIQILTFEAGAHGGLEGRFVILSFDGDDPDVPYIESQAGAVYLEATGDVTRISRAWSDVTARALTAEDSLAVLKRLTEGG